MAYGDKPTPLEQANYLRSEFDSRHPKFRLTVLSYLFEAGIKPGTEEETAQFLDTWEQIMSFLGGSLEDLAEMVEAFDPGRTELGEEVEVIPPDPRPTGYYL
jgi:hypothetical protein